MADVNVGARTTGSYNQTFDAQFGSVAVNSSTSQTTGGLQTSALAVWNVVAIRISYNWSEQSANGGAGLGFIVPGSNGYLIAGWDSSKGPILTSGLSLTFGQGGPLARSYSLSGTVTGQDIADSVSYGADYYRDRIYNLPPSSSTSSDPQAFDLPLEQVVARGELLANNLLARALIFDRTTSEAQNTPLQGLRPWTAVDASIFDPSALGGSFDPTIEASVMRFGAGTGFSVPIGTSVYPSGYFISTEGSSEVTASSFASPRLTYVLPADAGDSTATPVVTGLPYGAFPSLSDPTSSDLSTTLEYVSPGLNYTLPAHVAGPSERPSVGGLPPNVAAEYNSFGSSGGGIGSKSALRSLVKFDEAGEIESVRASDGRTLSAADIDSTLGS